MEDKEKLKLGKGVAFVKSRLKRLPQEDDTWEADFQALPQPIMKSETEYLGMVIEKQDGWFLANLTVHGRPSVNDLATLLAHAMRRPLAGNAHRPKVIRLRGHHQWRELFPALKELGIEVLVESTLPRFNEAYLDYLQEMREGTQGWNGQADQGTDEGRVDVPGHRQVCERLWIRRNRRSGELRLRGASLGLRWAGLRGRHTRDTCRGDGGTGCGIIRVV